jgi:hypothetical protein
LEIKKKVDKIEGKKDITFSFLLFAASNKINKTSNVKKSITRKKEKRKERKKKKRKRAK